VGSYKIERSAQLLPMKNAESVLSLGTLATPHKLLNLN
jgi:hypothetical protein